MNYRPIIFLLAAFFITPLYGDEANVTYTVSYHGRCSMKMTIEAQENASDCKGLLTFVFNAFKTGRVQYFFSFIRNGQVAVIAFSGGIDRQPILTHYELEIDSVIFSGEGTGTPTKKSAKGLCTMDGDPNGIAIHRCKATLSDTRPLTRFEFTFESAEATIHSFE